MADAPPNSYRDPYWSDLASKTESKLDLPPGLLVSLLTRGERSNHNQVSEAGARTAFQITPTTRNLVLKRDGIDAYLSPENAAEVAGLVAKDGVNWAKTQTQDPAQIPALAAGYYHAGGDTNNWGPRTQSYVQRVTGGLPEMTDLPASPAPTDVPDPSMPAAGGQSTFDRAMAASTPDTPGSIANVFKAYSSGQMTPQDASDFETAVNAGHIMLPRGATLKTGSATGAPQANADAALIAAYKSGKMAPADASDFERLVRSGDISLPPGTGVGQSAAVDAIPGLAPGDHPPAAVAPPASTAPVSMGDQIVGAGETALQLATGATGGVVGMVGGTAKGLANAILDGSFGTPQANAAVEQAALQGASALTYAPRTAAGQAQSQAAGEALSNLIPVAGVAGAMPPLLSGVRAPAAVLARAGTEGVARDAATALAGPAAGDAAAAATASAITGAAKGAQRVADLASNVTTLPRRAVEMLRNPEEAKPTAGTMGSVGAAGTDMAAQRRATAEGLGFTGDSALTVGQATRDPAQLKFEVETAKMPDQGTPLRQRVNNQNETILRNFDDLIDKTGAEAPSLRATGAAVDDALVQQAAKEKTQIRAAYKAAENAGEMEAPVALDALVQHLNDSAPDAATAPVLDVARKRALQLGLATQGEDGTLVPAPVPLKTAETFRQAIGRATDFEPTNVRQTAIMKGLIDEATDGLGGVAYQQARALRRRYAQNYEDRAVIAKLVNNKRGTADRQVAFEDVHRHTILNGSLDDVRNVRRVLQRSGPEGAQAWRELQGQTAAFIRDEATKNVATDSTGARIVSPAALDKTVRSLDVDGRLDFIFGKQGAQRLRDLRDLAQYVRTVPPEAAVNTSNTAATLLSAMADVSLSGISGVPAPVVSAWRAYRSHVKDKALRSRIDAALGKQQPSGKRAPSSAPTNTTRH